MTTDAIWYEYQQRKSGQADKIGDSLAMANRPGSLRDTADGWLALMMRPKESTREQTAATILAAMMQAHAVANEHTGYALAFPPDYAQQAVVLADALRAALDGGK